jgi:peptide/nickel transport system permease protein
MNFLAKRFIVSIIILVFVVNLVFFLPRLAPGNAAYILASASRVPGSEVKILEARFGLNYSVSTQYVLYLKNTFATWPPYFGVSFLYYPITVSDLFAIRIPWTLLLIGTSLPLGLVIAYSVARLTSTRRGGKLEQLALYVAISMNSTPIFWTATLVLAVFSISLGWFPIYSNVSVGTTSVWDYIVSVVWHATLPILTLATALFGESYLLLRGSVQDILKTDYVTAAKSRGLKDSTVASRYILRNSLLPFVSVMSFSLAGLIARLILVEYVFGYPGVGDLVVDAAIGRDYPVLEGSLFYLTIIILVGGLVGEYLLVRLDPRLRD